MQRTTEITTTTKPRLNAQHFRYQVASILGIAAMTSVLSSTCVAETLSLALSDKSLKLDVSSESQGTNNISLEAAYLHNSHDRNLISLGLHAKNQSTPVTFLIGGKSYYSDLNGEDGFGISLGAKASYAFSQELSVQGQLYYSPSVTSFGDNQHYKEAEIKVNYKILPDGQIFLGYRNVTIDLEDIGNAELHKGGFAGVSFSF